MFLLVFFICGSVWGFLESYLFWFLEDLGSTKLTMGLSLAVGTIAGVPLTIGSAFIIGRLGYQNLLYVIVAVLTRRTMFLQAPFPHMNVNIWLNHLPESHCSGTTMWSCSPSLFTAFAFLATPSSTHPWSPFSLRWCQSWITQWQWKGVQRSVILPIISLSRRTKDIDLQVLKPFGNSLLMIAAMTYAKNNADISTMASLEVTWFSKGIGCNL